MLHFCAIIGWNVIAILRVRVELVIASLIDSCQSSQVVLGTHARELEGYIRWLQIQSRDWLERERGWPEALLGWME